MRSKLYVPLILLLLWSSCGPSDDEKRQAAEAFIDRDYHFKDTLLHYQLDSSTLELIFPTIPEYDQWKIEAGLMHKITRKEIYLGSHIKTVRNKSIVFDNVVIPGDSVEYYDVWVFACPHVKEKMFIAQPFGNIRSMWRVEDSVRKILKPDAYWKGLYFVRFNLDVRDTLSEELKMYCHQIMLEELQRSNSE
jgi:hypothetical protein